MKYPNNAPIAIDCLVEARNFVATRLVRWNLDDSDREKRPDENDRHRTTLGEDAPEWLIRVSMIYVVETYKSQLKSGPLQLSFSDLTSKDCLGYSSREFENILTPM